MRKMLKVMLTEDGSETLHELAGILRSNNCEVSTVIKDGTQIVEKLKSGEVPDVLLMDGFMSRLDALGVLRELGAMRLERRPMVMVLSSADNQRFEGEVLRSGGGLLLPQALQPRYVSREDSAVLKHPQRKRQQQRSEGSRGGRVADNAPDRRAGTYQGLSVSARGDNPLGQKRRDDKLGHKGALSDRRQNFQNHAVTSGEGNTPRHRGGVGQRRR